MATGAAGRLEALLEYYRPQMREGGHPAELPDRVLELLREASAKSDTPMKLKRLIDAADRYWNLHTEDGDPDPLDLEMVNDELIDALYHYYRA